MAAASYQHQYHDHRPLTIYNRDNETFVRVRPQSIAKRKSAVELLQETKPLYVKSEIVLDRKQELRRSLRDNQLPNHEDELLHSGFSACFNTNPSSPHINHVCRMNSANSSGGTSVAFPFPKSPRLIPPPPAFRKSTCSLQLQNKLRKLLNADSKDNLLDAADSATANKTGQEKKYECDLLSLGSTNNLNTKLVNNSNCDKSLPDLTNIHAASSKKEQLEAGCCNCPSYLICSDRGCQNAPIRSTFTLPSLQKDRTSHHLSECETSGIDRNWEIDDTDHVKIRGNSLPTSPVKSCNSYITPPPPPLYCDESVLLKIRPVSRSKSDVGVRNLSSLQPDAIPLYDSASLNMFFDHLGLNSEEYSSLTAPRSNASSPVFFSGSNSSVDSVGSRGSGNETHLLNPSADSVSIVERNARIIKWLCNCRKAFEQLPRLPAPLSR